MAIGVCERSKSGWISDDFLGLEAEGAFGEVSEKRRGPLARALVEDILVVLVGHPTFPRPRSALAKRLACAWTRPRCGFKTKVSQRTQSTVHIDNHDVMQRPTIPAVEPVRWWCVATDQHLWNVNHFACFCSSSHFKWHMMSFEEIFTPVPDDSSQSAVGDTLGSDASRGNQFQATRMF